MGLTDLLKPKWKHSDVAVRTAAVRVLDHENTLILAQIAKNDRDENICRLAIRKIDDPKVLTDLAKSNIKESLKQIALERASTLWVNVALQDSSITEATLALAQLSDDKFIAEVAKKAGLEPIRQTALQRLSDPKALADVARHATEPQTGLAAIALIDDQDVLRGIAIDDLRREAALFALEKINDSNSLEAIAQRAKIKAVRTKAKRKLTDIHGHLSERQDESLQEKQLHAQMIQLCRSVENLALTSDFETAKSTIQQAQTQWAQILDESETEDEELNKRFEATCARFFARFEQNQQRHVEKTKKMELLREDFDTRASICEQIEKLTGTEATKNLADLENQWKQLGPIPKEHGEDIVKRFSTACMQCRKQYEQTQKAEEKRKDFQKLIESVEQISTNANLNHVSKELTSLSHQWDQLEKQVGSIPELKTRFDEMLKQLETREADYQAKQQQMQSNNLARLNDICSHLERLVNSDNLRAAETHLKKARAALAKPGVLPQKQDWESLRPKLQKGIQTLSARIQELKEAQEWKQWSNVPKREELCQKAEQLLQVKDLKNVADQLRDLQAEWKKVGPVSKNKSEELWKRFKTTCDKVYARCEEYFAQLAKEYEENLKKKEAICEKVEELAKSTDWEKTAEQFKELQKEWKDIGPVPRKKSNAIWKRFRSICDGFFEKRQEQKNKIESQREENLKAKQALCERAETLAESSEWKETAEKFKQLQIEWKAIGPVPRKDSDAIWNRFRGACDRFFERRKSYLDEGRSANLARKVELCTSLDQMLTSSDDKKEPQEIVQKVVEVWKEWKTIGPIPEDETIPMQEKLHGICKQAIESYSEAFCGTELDPSISANKKEKICEQLKQLARSTPHREDVVYLEEPDDESDVDTMVEILRKAMASNTFKEESQKADKQRIADQVETAQKNWLKTSPVPGEKGLELQKRFEQAYAKAVRVVEPRGRKKDN